MCFDTTALYDYKQKKVKKYRWRHCGLVRWWPSAAASNAVDISHAVVVGHDVIADASLFLPPLAVLTLQRLNHAQLLGFSALSLFQLLPRLLQVHSCLFLKQKKQDFELELHAFT